WILRRWRACARRFYSRREEIQSAVAAALCQRAPKSRLSPILFTPGQSELVPFVISNFSDLRYAPARSMVLVIDNYDSFTYNLVQYLGEMNVEMRVHRNDQITLDQIRELKP